MSEPVLPEVEIQSVSGAFTCYGAGGQSEYFITAYRDGRIMVTLPQGEIPLAQVPDRREILTFAEALMRQVRPDLADIFKGIITASEPRS